MDKTKIHPRIISARIEPKSDHFFLRLVSSQRFLAIIGLVFLVAIIFPLARTYSQRRLVEKEISDVKSQISEFENQNQQLKDLIAYLQSDQSLEEQARLNLNLKKPGEAVVVIEGKSGRTMSPPATASSTEEGNLAKWWQYFFN